MSRRGLLVPAVLAALALTLSAAGCGARQAAADTLVFAVDDEPLVLDPHASPQDSAALFTRPVLDSLVSLGPDGRIEPWLATAWSISPDRRTYTFTLREDVKFSDGTRFDAAAVKANLDHIADPKTQSRLAAHYMEPYTGSTVVDARTVKVHFAKPHAPFLAALSEAFFGMQSPASLRRGPDVLARHVVGSGPFVIERYVPHQEIVYRRNPDYRWGPATARHTGPARLARLKFTILTEDSVRLGALTSGQADAIASVPPVTVRRVRANPRLRVETRPAPGGVYMYLPNVTRGVFADRRVREAFRIGIDYPTIVRRLYFGLFDPAFSPLSTSTPSYDPATRERWRLDRAAAGRLLDEAGWTGRDRQGYRTRNGRRLVVRWPFQRSVAREQRAELAELVQAEARRLGIDLRIGNVSQAEYFPRYAAGDYDLVDYVGRRIDGDMLRNLFATSFISTPDRFGQNGARYSDRRVDGWLAAALATDDQAERADLYARVQRRVMDESAAFPVYVPAYVLGVSKTVHGIGWSPLAYPTFYEAWVSDR
ncbi:peptide ABC transporter [Actinomadura sp. NBRC 104425]|uniref:ABC transporter substrate-binding protein n=1 Tax=Actinomadura sp. NBRC 104425 TaxID=3032204 RepID=UPI0024A2A598|nr:ABC transporter substrate-binding protein [Actinomadura sp. NBRC 104425]GLZ15453.1 peptide ABC transporter [Actinomadura sp. NBRC 104425]